MNDDYPDIPRVDAHIHPYSMEGRDRMIRISRILKDKYDINLEIWMDCADKDPSFGKPGVGLGDHREIYPSFLKEIGTRYNGRWMHRIGLGYSPEDIEYYQSLGAVGCKMKPGRSIKREGDRWQDWLLGEKHEDTWEKMVEIGFVPGPVHITSAYPGKYCDDPIEHWALHKDWEGILDRHPNLEVMMAHFWCHYGTDRDIDYLRFLLHRYPNAYLDASGGCLHWVGTLDKEHLRRFVIDHSDRILFGSDFYKLFREHQLGRSATDEDFVFRYMYFFNRLERDHFKVPDFTDDATISPLHRDKNGESWGLDLPREALENIYYKNAARLYPQVDEKLEELGYQTY